MQPELIAPKTRDEIGALRRECGVWLREKREAAGLSQRELANKVGFEYYTFISQIEGGRGRVPPERYEIYAIALELDPRDFVMTMMRYNDPISYEILFGERVYPQKKTSKAEPMSMDDLARRLSLIESKLSL